MRLPTALTFVALSVLSASANAGLKAAAPVKVGQTLRYAQGGLSAARASSNVIEYIDCSMDLDSNGTMWITCSARDSTNEYAYCTTNDPKYIKPVQMIRESSWVKFQWDSAHSCTNIYVQNDSQFLP